LHGFPPLRLKEPRRKERKNPIPWRYIKKVGAKVTLCPDFGLISPIPIDEKLLGNFF